MGDGREREERKYGVTKIGLEKREEKSTSTWEGGAKWRRRQASERHVVMTDTTFLFYWGFDFCFSLSLVCPFLALF